MSQKTTIKSDFLGLYVIAGGWIARPFYGTKYKAGDQVLSHHFGGSSYAGVTTPGKPATHNFKRDGQHEMWSTTGVMNYNYSKLSNKEIKEKTKWYENNAKGIMGTIHKEENSKFNP